MRVARYGSWRRSFAAAERSFASPRLSASTTATQWPICHTAVWTETSFGMTLRASAVRTSYGGAMATNVRLGAMSKHRERVRPSSTNELTSPPMSAGATLSGWPSILVAKSSAASASKPPAWSTCAATTPATTQVELDPRPPESGTGESMVMCRACGRWYSSRQVSR